MTIETGNTHFGMPTMNIKSESIHQSYPDDCVVKSLEILSNHAGHSVSEDELIIEAYNEGVYTPGKGSVADGIGDIIHNHGCEAMQVKNASIFNLVGELYKDNLVLIGVDSGELWNPGLG